MATTTTSKQEGSDIVVTTAFELIGVGLLALLAGTSDKMGTVVVIVMAGFMIGWGLINSGTLTKLLGNPVTTKGSSISSIFNPFTQGMQSG